MNDKLITIAQFTYPHEAHLARGILENEGIVAFVLDEHSVGMNVLRSHALGGVKVQVLETDAERARAVLNTLPPQGETKAWPPESTACPRCGGDKIGYSEVSKGLSSIMAFIFMLPFFRRVRLKCDSCGAVWKA